MNISELLNNRLTVVELAQGLGISVQAIYKWEIIPLNRVNDVQRITGIPREKLRPDFFIAQPPASSEVAQ